jgi:hypothetical protein
MKKLGNLLITHVLVLTLAACSLGNTATTVGTNTSLSSYTTTSSTTPDENTLAPTAAASVVEVLAEKSESHEDAEDYVWDSAAVVAIKLNGDSIAVDGEGVTVEGSQATVTSAGTYSLSGSLADGQILVKTDAEQVVQLILNGADIRSSTSAPINIEKADEVVIILAEDTENTISDGTNYSFENPSGNEPNGAIFSNADLSISGSGSLTVNGNFNDGISSDDGLVIAGGTIMVNAVDDGIRGKDYLVVKNGNITVNAQGDGLKSDNEEDAAKGYIMVEAGTFQIVAGGDGIQAGTDVMILDGVFTILSGGGSSTRATASISTKGIKGASNVNIGGGIFKIDSADDALHSNGNITVNGGTFTLATGDDGLHADATLTINGGSISITRSYEGIESAVITINGGDIHIVSSDDGINVAGGADASGFNPGQGEPGMRPGMKPGMKPGPGQDFFAASGDYRLVINGGYIAIEASGDGIDSNGTIEMSAGTVLVNGPTEAMNGALDHAGFNLTGGTLVAAGSSQMAQAPGQTSSQNSVLIYLTSVQQAGTLVHIRSSAGQDILTFAPSKQYSSVAFSSPDLKQGETYQVYIGGSSTGTATDSLVQGGDYTPGTLYTSFTVSGTLTTIGSGGGGFRRP